MKKLYFVLTLLAFVLHYQAFAGQTAAKMNSFDLHVASIKVLQQRDVQADMGVTTAQRARMEKYADGYNSELAAYIASLRKQNKGNVQLPDKTVETMLARLKQNVMAVLEPEQLSDDVFCHDPPFADGVLRGRRMRLAWLS